MRYVPAGQLQPGMVLGQGLHDASGRMLLAPNTSLTNENWEPLGSISMMRSQEIFR